MFGQMRHDDASAKQQKFPLDAIVVDADRLFRRHLSHLLRAEGFTVRGCDTGAALVAAMTDRTTHLVVLDVDLGPEDGVELCRELRSSGGADLAIVMTGAESMSLVEARIDEVSCLAAGANAYVVKGRSSHPFQHTIRSVMGLVST